MGNPVLHLYRRCVAIALCMLLVWGIGLYVAPSANALMRQVEEAPGQMVYQSRQTLRDQHGNTWQAIAFTRVTPDQSMGLTLRLVGFPGIVDIERSRPLVLTSSLGETWTLADASAKIFTHADQPAPNVAQYNLFEILDQLQTVVPLQLTVPIVQGEDIHLSVIPAILQEWREVAQQGIEART